MSDPQENLHFLDYWRIISSRKEIVIAVSLLVVITGFLITHAMPKVYRASTVIQVKEEAPDVAVFTPEMMRFDPLFLRTQFEIIQSGPVIEEVVRRLNLTETLGRAYEYLDGMNFQDAFDFTVGLIAKRMKVQQYRDTNLIEIQIYMDEPKEIAPEIAAEIANAIAETYREQNMMRSRSVTENALKALKQSRDEQATRVDELEEKAAAIRERYAITELYRFPSSGVGNVLEKETLRVLDAQRIRIRLEMEDKKARYEKCSALAPDALLAAAPWLAADPALATLVNERTQAEIKLRELLDSGYGRKHPDVSRVQAVADAIQKKIDEGLEGLKTGLLADYEAAQAKSAALEQMLEDTRFEDIESEGTGYREYETALAELEHSRKIRDALELRYVQENIELRIPRTAVEVVEPAKAPDKKDPVSPDYALNIILSVILGLGSGVGLAYFIEYLDTSVKTIEDIERFLDVPVMGVIPQKVKPLIEEDADPAHAEAYRVLRTNIKSSKKLGGNAICITSGSVGEGKSLTLFNLAYTCATLGERVLVVDSDLHRPRQHKMLEVSNSKGLANVLVGETKVEDVIIQTDFVNFDFLPSGKLSTGVHGLLDTVQMRDLIERLKGMYDYVFFDAPPIVGVSDASLLARGMDAVLLVVQHRKYPRALSSRAKNMVENTGATLLGVVLNNINVSRDYSSYYYQQHYYSYPSRGAARTQARRKKQPAKSKSETAETNHG